VIPRTQLYPFQLLGIKYVRSAFDTPRIPVVDLATWIFGLDKRDSIQDWTSSYK